MISIKTKSLILFLLAFSCATSTNAQTFIGKNIKVNIFSSTPVEDIKAASSSGTAVLIAQKQELAIQVNIKSLEFDKKLMQEHFNENYMESDKYPVAKFKGIISPKIDWTKDGEYNVTAKGTLSVHGVDQPRNIIGKITIKNGAVNLFSTFDVACAAHQIKIPSLVFTKIAEVIKVTIQGTLTPLNK
ncbi:YceI family protein [Pedobacter frigiditerrae]|uniref:YceI family protein n=1 Tax=Pedobacter frigiditerrae TaxID=2530452 RepID=A0A4R0N0Z7_9SPHI|nr:YceI family protein [Pedobacter frigiditerrae]TCC93335.1 YceI family protein [Pedobacter frigiditerrae]